jgi:hypothetical protein
LGLLRAGTFCLRTFFLSTRSKYKGTWRDECGGGIEGKK